MRLRNAAVAALGAFTLLLAVPNSASAAVGEFNYKIGEGDGILQSILDPESGSCINLAGTSETDVARAPGNLTDATATVFLESDCNGDVFYVMNPGKVLGSKLELRSVVFS
ncbi:hypothetical protein [Streptomyces vinaceus]|uniref:hypothetical protein n=1 Tax=Streptomyces vinaceus TaxID=1960 RepID=UPI0036A30E4A